MWETVCEARASRQVTPEKSVEHDGCVPLMERVYKDDVTSPDPPHITGEWVSRRLVLNILIFIHHALPFGEKESYELLSHTLTRNFTSQALPTTRTYKDDKWMVPSDIQNG